MLIYDHHIWSSYNSLEALWETLLGSPGLPGGSLGLQGHGRRLGGKMIQNHSAFLSKVARPTISAESGEGDPHDLRSLRTKVGVYSSRGSHRPAPGPSPDRQNPYS